MVKKSKKADSIYYNYRLEHAAWDLMSAKVYKVSRGSGVRLVRCFGKTVGFEIVFDELFRFGDGEAKEGDGVNPIFEGDGVVDVVFLGEATDLVHLFFRGGFDCGAHLFNEWFETGLDISPLNASIKLPQNMRPIFGASEKIYQKLPPFLADSLPDAWGNELFEQWRQQQGIKLGEITPLDKLAFIGKRAMGALEFQPETSNFVSKESLDLKALIDLANQIYTQREQAHIHPDESLTMQALLAVGTSAGGRQPKAIIAINRETGDIRSGQIGGLKGYEYCILKFGNHERSTAELEMAYYEMAVKAGIKMMPCWLIDIKGEQHFVTKRFDRDGERKIHMQTLAALYPEADSYERLLWVCRKMQLSEQDSEEVFRRMVFNILANNTDDHNKNYSFLMDEQGRWSLSPAYDMTYIFNTGGFLPETRHCLMIRGKYTDITLDDVMQLAAENGIRKAGSIIHQVVEAIKDFRQFASKHGAKERWINAIENTLKNNLDAWGLTNPSTIANYIDESGRQVENVRIEQYSSIPNIICL